MPKVHRTVKSYQGKTIKCVAPICKVAEERGDDRTIRPGDEYWRWSRRNAGTFAQHTACGFPRQSMLSSRKTAAVADAVSDAEAAIQAWLKSVEVPIGAAAAVIDISGLLSALADVASTAESVADEYEESADNLPDNLHGGSQYEAMTDVAERLRDWAGNLERWEPDGGTDTKLIRSEIQDALEDLAQEAIDAMQEMPEYEG